MDAHLQRLRCIIRAKLQLGANDAPLALPNFPKHALNIVDDFTNS